MKFCSLSAAIISALIKLETIYPCFQVYIFVKIKRAYESFVLNLVGSKGQNLVYVRFWSKKPLMGTEQVGSDYLEFFSC